MLELELTDKAKSKARKRREKYEKKWRIFRPVSWISDIYFILGTIMILFIVPIEEHSRFSFFNEFFRFDGAFCKCKGVVIQSYFALVPK